MRAVVSGVLAGVLAALTLVVDAQPAGAQPADAQPASDRERAKALYQAAEAAMREARYEDAIRDYGAAYELTKDPALLYKLGSANERAGKCDAAVTYYRRYLRDGKPKEDFAKLTRAKIAACGADPDAPLPPDPAPGPAPGPATPVPAPGPDGAGATPPPGGSGAVTQPGSGGGPAKPDTAGAPTKPDAAGAPTKPDAAGAPTRPDASGAPAKPDAAGAAGSAAATAPAPRRGRHNGPWLLVGGSLALVTTGAVLAYSANAAERDLEDLYVGLNGTPPPFNSTTRRLYDDAIAEGRRYQTLSIVSFSLAGAMALGAGLWFALGRDEQITVAPAVSPGTAGVSTTLRF
jgi:tetratricopeptide (TPR) repeat protein